MGSVREGIPEDRTPEEQLAWLKNRVDELEARYDARLHELAERQEEIERRIAAYERRLEEHERRVALLEARIDAVRRGEAVPEIADEDWAGFQTRH